MSITMGDYKKEQIVTVMSTLLVLLFVYTAASKLLDLDDFAKQLAKQPLPDWSHQSLRWLIPGAELLISGLLIYKPSRRIGFYGSTVVMILFTGYVGLALLKVFDQLPCSCGGVIRHIGFKTHFIFNLFFLAVSMLGIYMSNPKRKEESRQ